MFKIKSLNDEITKEIKSNKLLNIMFERFNAILSGGTAHSILTGWTIEKHLSKNNMADLDLYFPNVKMYEKAIDYVKTETNFLIEQSVTGLCQNIYQRQNTHWEEPSHINKCKIQLVGCVFGSPEDIITSFDFKNLEVCCFKKKNKYVLMHSDNPVKFNNLLDIRHTNSPFLMHRVYKYMTYRGFVGVTERSKKHITDWIIKASSGFYEENLDGCKSIYVDLLDNYGVRSLLKNPDIITNDDLVFMVGKIKEDVFKEVESTSWRGYVNTQKVLDERRDLVIEEMRNRESEDESK
tara:strand:- start:507 stop:1388 length:882 start_codon:yes stop_codon:yes gene_type:complete